MVTPFFAFESPNYDPLKKVYAMDLHSPLPHEASVGYTLSQLLVTNFHSFNPCQYSTRKDLLITKSKNSHCLL